MTTETQQVIDYASKRLEIYKARANAERRPELAAEYRVSAMTLGVLIGELRAGFHVPSPPPVCLHVNAKKIGYGTSGPSLRECGDCGHCWSA